MWKITPRTYFPQHLQMRTNHQLQRRKLQAKYQQPSKSNPADSARGAKCWRNLNYLSQNPRKPIKSDEW